MPHESVNCVGVDIGELSAVPLQLDWLFQVIWPAGGTGAIEHEMPEAMPVIVQEIVDAAPLLTREALKKSTFGSDGMSVQVLEPVLY